MYFVHIIPSYFRIINFKAFEIVFLSSSLLCVDNKFSIDVTIFSFGLKTI